MTTVYSRHPDLRLTPLEGEGVALHLGSRQYFSVNATGLTILDALREPRTMAELVTTVTEEYEIDAESAEASVRRFLARCIESALVRTVER